MNLHTEHMKKRSGKLLQKISTSKRFCFGASFERDMSRMARSPYTYHTLSAVTSGG